MVWGFGVTCNEILIEGKIVFTHEIMWNGCKVCFILHVG